MKKKKTKKLLKGFTIDPTVKKHDDHPLVKLKLEKANHILEKVKLPKDIY